jgi:flagellar basal body-associated protein FliL
MCTMLQEGHDDNQKMANKSRSKRVILIVILIIVIVALLFAAFYYRRLWYSGQMPDFT